MDDRPAEVAGPGRGMMEEGNRNCKPEIVNSHHVEIQHLFLCNYDFTIFYNLER
jgi:hypothetical protein